MEGPVEAAAAATTEEVVVGEVDVVVEEGETAVGEGDVGDGEEVTGVVEVGEEATEEDVPPRDGEEEVPKVPSTREPLSRRYVFITSVRYVSADH